MQRKSGSDAFLIFTSVEDVEQHSWHLCHGAEQDPQCLCVSLLVPCDVTKWHTCCCLPSAAPDQITFLVTVRSCLSVHEVACMSDEVNAKNERFSFLMSLRDKSFKRETFWLEVDALKCSQRLPLKSPSCLAPSYSKCRYWCTATKWVVGQSGCCC